jgi:MFS superfamily sulfate permease-like transporter
LAGIVIVVGIFLIDVAGFRRLWHVRRWDFAFAAIATTGVVFLGMLAGVFIAVLLSLFDVARRALTPKTAVLVQVPGTDRFRDEAEVEDGQQVPGLLVYRFDAPLIFANFDVAIEEIKAHIRQAPAPVTGVLISAEAITDIDITALDGLDDYVTDLRARGVAVGIARLKTEVADQLERAGVLAGISEAVYLEVDDGVEAFKRGDFGAG